MAVLSSTGNARLVSSSTDVVTTCVERVSSVLVAPGTERKAANPTITPAATSTPFRWNISGSPSNNCLLIGEIRKASTKKNKPLSIPPTVNIDNPHSATRAVKNHRNPFFFFILLLSPYYNRQYYAKHSSSCHFLMHHKIMFKPFSLF